jgi:hypothetical protein
MEKIKVRGKEADLKLKKILEEMIRDGYKTSPISRSSVLKKLGYKSRSTLLLNNRAQLIEEARKTQLQNMGLKLGTSNRKSLVEQLDNCKKKLIESEGERKKLLSILTTVIYNLNARGLNVEEIMQTLRF